MCVALKKFSSLTSDTCPPATTPCRPISAPKAKQTQRKKAATAAATFSLSLPRCNANAMQLPVAHSLSHSSGSFLSLPLSFYIRSRHDEAELCDCFWLRAVPPPFYPGQPHCLLSSPLLISSPAGPAPRPRLPALLLMTTMKWWHPHTVTQLLPSVRSLAIMRREESGARESAGGKQLAGWT